MIIADLNDIQDYKTMFDGKDKATNLNQLKKLIYSIAYGLTKNKQIVEEVVQEAIYKIVKNLHNYNPEQAKFSSWAGFIARNVVIDLLRRKENKENLPLDVDIENNGEESSIPIVVSDEDTYESAVKTIDNEKLNQIVNMLKPKYYDAIKMFYYDGLSQEEIAAQLGIPIATVKTWLLRGKAEIKKQLGDDFLNG